MHSIFSKNPQTNNFHSSSHLKIDNLTMGVSVSKIAYIFLLLIKCENRCSENRKYISTVKIHDSALSLSGFVNFFGGRICGGGAYPRRIYGYVLWAYLAKLTF